MQKPRTQGSSAYLSRRRWTAEDAGEALTALARSGLQLSAFATREGLDAQRLTKWRRRLAPEVPPVFEEVITGSITAVVHGAAAGRAERERFEIVLSSGRMVRVPESFDADALRRLLAVIDGGGPC